MKNNTPYFLWDYDLSKKDVKKILRKDNQASRRWLIARILESASLKDVWNFLDPKQIKEVFPQLKLKKPVKKAWQRAFKAWGY